jgi:hypothetical protein
MAHLPKIIAICGFKRSGKDTIADYLCKHHGYTKIKISAPLKDGLKSFFGFTDEQLESDIKDKVDPVWGVTPRSVMQYFGTEVMQYQIQTLVPGIGRNFWIKRLVSECIGDKEKRFVIPDMRFRHEYDMLKTHGALFWRVERALPASFINTEVHASEKEFLDIPVSNIFHNIDDHRHMLYQDVDNQLTKNSVS